MSTVLKWAGGKTELMSEISRVLPAGNRLIEPFAGSCAVTVNTSFEQYIIADVNQDLIDLYSLVRDNPEALMAQGRDLFSHANNRDDYYELRELFNKRTSEPVYQSVLFLYLNRHGYRGLCRYNKGKGFFNVPYGHYKKPHFPEKEINRLNQKLQRSILMCAGFQETLMHAVPGDIVYCDPPYIAKGRFTEYHFSPFGMVEQRLLVDTLNQLAARGVSIVASSHDSPEMRDIYVGYEQKHVVARRSVGVAAGKGKSADELIVHRVAESFPAKVVA